jgi:hypothetical protein
LALTALLACAGSVRAHHALEYIELESSTTTRKGEGVFHLLYDYMVDDEDEPRLDHWELTPGISYGLTDRVMVNAHTHFASFSNGHVVDERQPEFEPDGPSPFLEALAVSLQGRLFETPIANFGAVATVELPFDRAEELLGSEDEVYQGILILGRDFDGHRNITVNLGYEVEGSEDEFLWGIGAKTPLSANLHGISGSLECFGSFDHPDDNWMVLPGIGLPVGGNTLIVKTGIGIGEEDGAGALRAHVSMLHIF